MAMKWEWVNKTDPTAIPLPSTTPNSPSKFNSQVDKIGRDIRDISRTASRVGEAVVGTPGNLLNMGLGVANYVTGGHVPTYEKIQEHLPLSFPTSEQAKEFTSKLTQGFTDPQTEGEQLWDNIVSDFTSFLVPYAGSGVKNVLKAGNIALSGAQAVAGNLAQQVAKNLGLGKGVETAANIGATLLTGIAGTKASLINRMNNSFNKAEQLAAGHTAKVGDLGLKVNKNFEKIMTRDFPGKQFIIERFNHALPWLTHPTSAEEWLRPTNKKISIDQVMQSVKDLNKFYPEAQKLGVTRELNSLAEPLRDFLGSYSSTINAPKDFSKFYKESRDIFTGLKSQNTITKFLNKYVALDSPLLKNPLSKALLYFSPWFGGTKPIIGVAGAVAARETARLVDLIANSKEAANAFKDIGLGALNQSSSQVNRGLINFDKAVSKSKILPPGYEWVKKSN